MRILSSVLCWFHVAAFSLTPASLPAETIRVGLIGLDTSHVIAFTNVINDSAATGDLADLKVVAGFPGGTDIPASKNRVDRFTRELRERGIEIVDSIPALLEKVDVVMLESVDGRPHLEQVKPVFAAKKLVFIDKPLAGSLADAVAIDELSKKHDVAWFSSSALRFRPGIAAVRSGRHEAGKVLGCETWGPCSIEPTHPDLFWYGVHGVEALFTIMGAGCRSVARVHTKDADVVTGVWNDGRTGTYRGLRAGRKDFGGIVFGSEKIVPVSGSGGYKGLLTEVARFFKTGRPPVSSDETIEMFAFMEAADESKRRSGALVSIAEVLAEARAEARKKIAFKWVTAAGHPAEDKVGAFLGKPELEMQQVFRGQRFPNIVVAVDGTVIATWGSGRYLVRRSEDGGKSWGDPITVANPGFQGGGVTVNEKTGEILAFIEEKHPPAPLAVYRSTDHGKTWRPMKSVIGKDENGNVPSMHMNEHGITLRHGKHRGRLLRPSRWYAGKNERARWPKHYTNAIYSDDGGKTWHVSEPFPENGTGEACVAGLADGRIYYNSRVHWEKNPKNTRRRDAYSFDGGETWSDFRIVEVLPDGPQDTNYGCMGGLVRLPVEGKDILVYSNCDSPGGRRRMTVWVSFDGGRTWPMKRLVFKGNGAYSSLNAGRPRTASEGWIYLQFEGGPKGGSTVARFNLSWILQGEATGDGKVPEELGGSAGANGETVQCPHEP